MYPWIAVSVSVEVAVTVNVPALEGRRYKVLKPLLYKAFPAETLLKTSVGVDGAVLSTLTTVLVAVCVLPTLSVPFRVYW